MFDLTEALLEKVSELEAQANLFRDQRDRLNEEARKGSEERDALNARVKEMLEEASELRLKRDALNQKVQELKKLRDEARTRLSERRKKGDGLKMSLRSFQGQFSVGERETRELMRSLEWRIQTTPLEPKEESELMEQMRALERQRLIHEQIGKLRSELTELHAEIRALRVKANHHHEQLYQLARASQSCHQKMLKIYKQVEEIRPQAEAAHGRYVETRRKADESHQNLVKTLSQIKEIKQQLKRYHEKVRRETVEEMAKDREETAREKLKRGEKLTFEEFKILVEKGVIK